MYITVDEQEYELVLVDPDDTEDHIDGYDIYLVDETRQYLDDDPINLGELVYIAAPVTETDLRRALGM